MHSECDLKITSVAMTVCFVTVNVFVLGYIFSLFMAMEVEEEIVFNCLAMEAEEEIVFNCLPRTGNESVFCYCECGMMRRRILSS